MIEVYDMYDLSDVADVIVFAKGTIESPNVTKIIKIDLTQDIDIEAKRSELYAAERKGIRRSFGQVFIQYNKSDFLSERKHEGNSFEGDGNNNRLNTKRSRSEIKANPITQFHVNEDENTVTYTYANGETITESLSKTSRELDFIEYANEMSDVNTVSSTKGDTLYSVDDNFYAEYDAWDQKDTNKTFTIGTTSDSLRSIGMKAQNIILKSGTVVQKVKKHPEISFETFKRIPELLEHPIIVQFSDAIDPVTKKPKYDSRITVLGELYSNNRKPVLVALELLPTNRKQTTILDFSVAVSAYEKNALQQYLNENSILFIDPNKKRTNKWLSLNRLQLPLGENQYGSVRSIAYVDGKVKVQNKKNMTPTEIALRKAGVIDDFGNLNQKSDTKESDTLFSVDEDIDSKRYSYEELTSKPDMKVKILPQLPVSEIEKYQKNSILFGKEMRDIASKANNPRNTSTSTYLYCTDLGVDVLITRDSFKHGAARMDATYIAVCKSIEDVLNNSVVINELTDREHTNGAYVLLGLAESVDSYVVVRSIVNKKTWKLDSYNELYAIKKKSIKKEDVGLKPPHYIHKNGYGTSSTISVAQFLEFVNSQNIANSVLSLDVINKLGLTRGFDENVTPDLLYSRKSPDSVSTRSLLANALESTVQNDIERNKLEQYKSKIELIESEYEKLSQLKAKIKELSFAKGANGKQSTKIRIKFV